MRAAAVVALAAAACASTPPPTSTAVKTNGVVAVRPQVPPAPPPARPPPPAERAERVIAAQLKSDRASVTGAFWSVEIDALSSDADRARSALEAIREIARRVDELREPYRYEITVTGDGFEPLLDRIDQVLAKLAHMRDCSMYLAVESAAGQMAFVPRGRDMAKGMLIGPSRPMSKRTIVCGMEAIKPKVLACYAQHQVAGLVIVNVTINRAGTVTAAAAAGKFAGTPTGVCVEEALKTATFPPSDGIQTPYPFALK